MYPKGFVSLREVVRLKALLFSLENDQLDLQKQLSDHQDTLRLLLNERNPVYIEPLPDLTVMDSLKPDKYPLSALMDTALHNRFDLLAFQSQNLYAKTDLSYQRSLNIPNPTIMAGWDHNGGFVPNYNYLGLSLDLPFWARNRGNIGAAEARLEAAKALYDNYELQVTNQVRQSYAKALRTDQLYRSTGFKFGEDFTSLIHGATDNFLKHQLGLLEFVDLYETYKDSQNQLIQLQNDRIVAVENLSYTIGKQLNYK
jgi:cobalt-zinc-cadmium efflux system outer membrane protein